MLDPIGTQRTRDILRDHLNNVLRMMEGIDSGDRSHTAATVILTCNAAASALQTAVHDIDVIKAGYSARVTPRASDAEAARDAEPFLRGRISRLPAIAGTGGLS